MKAGSVRILVGLGVMAVALSLADAARAACRPNIDPQCLADFASFDAIAAGGSGFVVVGRKREVPDSVFLVDLTTGSGQLEAVAEVRIDLPRAELERRGIASGELYPLPRVLVVNNRDIYLIGEVRVRIAGTTLMFGWAAHVPAGRGIASAKPRWNLLYDPSTLFGPASWAGDIQFRSATFDQRSYRLVVVGRSQEGPFDRACTRPSRALVAELHAGSGGVAGAVARGDTRPLRGRQGLYDIVPLHPPGRYLAVGFRSAPDLEEPGTCQDNLLVAVVEPRPPEQSPAGSMQGDVLTVVEDLEIGSDGEDELALSVQHLANDEYVITGYGHDDRTGSRAAQVTRIAVDPLRLLSPQVNQHHPQGGDAARGGDRFFDAVVIAGGRRVFAAGSSSTGPRAPNQALLGLYTRKLAAVGPAMVLPLGERSRIRQLAATSNDIVLAVGARQDGDEPWRAWVGPVFDRDQIERALLTPVPVPVALDRLPRLSSLPLRAGRYVLEPGRFDAGARFYDTDIAAGGQLRFSIPLDRAMRVQIAFSPLDGDGDLVLFDAGGNILAFSDRRGTAIEFLQVDLDAGDYTLAVIAHEPIAEFEFGVARADGEADDILDYLLALDEDARARLAGLLGTAGYDPGGNPEIGFGSEALLALKARFFAERRGVSDAGAIRRRLAVVFGE